LYALIDDELFEVDEADVELDEGGFWLAFEGEDEESFYEFCDIDENEFE
jgi:hypothetical protein